MTLQNKTAPVLVLQLIASLAFVSNVNLSNKNLKYTIRSAPHSGFTVPTKIFCPFRGGRGAGGRGLVEQSKGTYCRSIRFAYKLLPYSLEHRSALCFRCLLTSQYSFTEHFATVATFYTCVQRVSAANICTII
jgi:hypothetical protein